ncbi:type I toxin-antitoxin system Fst family toxin [Companilactobacillus tucceti]
MIDWRIKIMMTFLNQLIIGCLIALFSYWLDNRTKKK